jgi:hypothetical protein
VAKVEQTTVLEHPRRRGYPPGMGEKKWIGGGILQQGEGSGGRWRSYDGEEGEG